MAVKTLKKLTSKVAYLWQFRFFSLQPRLSKTAQNWISVYRFLYPMICGTISGVEPLGCQKYLQKSKKKRSQNMLHNTQQPLLSNPVMSIQYLNFKLDFQNNKISFFWTFYLSTVHSQKNILGKNWSKRPFLVLNHSETHFLAKNQ